MKYDMKDLDFIDALLYTAEAKNNANIHLFALLILNVDEKAIKLLFKRFEINVAQILKAFMQNGYWKASVKLSEFYFLKN